MIIIKEGVKIQGLQPEMLLGIRIIENEFESQGESLVITEITGGKHMQGSKHYVGQAIDVRSRTLLPTIKTHLLFRMKEALGFIGFQVLLENPDTNNEHFHIEFDPE